MKPLELVLWRKCPCEPDCRLMVPANLEGPDIFETNGVWGDDTKRLTDAELAAEYHAEAGRFCCDAGHPHEARLDTLERFATHDHYDEGDS